jgi:hypothetical protein
MTNEERYKSALEVIRDHLGAVCDGFLDCSHRSCADSCAACIIAGDALNGIFDPEAWPETSVPAHDKEG